VKLLCEVVADNKQQGKTPLEAVAAVNTYFQIKNATDCYDFDPKYILIGTSLASYSYQCCTQVGHAVSRELVRGAGHACGVCFACFGLVCSFAVQ
jgi:hypothetical protein